LSFIRAVAEEKLTGMDRIEAVSIQLSAISFRLFSLRVPDKTEGLDAQHGFKQGWTG
jgi:hypothetical protein